MNCEAMTAEELAALIAERDALACASITRKGVVD